MARTLVRKTLRPLIAGRHAALADDPRHWAYWRREAEAYRSGLLPLGPGLRTPLCYGVVDNEIYLESVEGPAVPVGQAAEHLARWQVPYESSLDRPWLAMDQLGQRLKVSELDWTTVEADPRVVQLWQRQWDLYEELIRVPSVRSHGDYSAGNLVRAGSDTVALDWATFGWEPLGFDLAHLALSTGEDPTDAYCSAAGPAVDAIAVRAGYRTAVATIGASRIHWMLSRGIRLPEWYVEFISTSR